MRWHVPPLHVRVCAWLEQAWLSYDRTLLLMLPRGHAKSTILEIFNAWIYYNWPLTRVLHQSESDKTALKTSRGTKNVMQRHPLTAGMMRDAQGEIESWWLPDAFAHDSRNASMHAKGIVSNVTSARADFIQNDDVEVPRNIGNPEMRDKMRYRLGEQVHIAVPGAQKLWIGTPHTHESIYDEVKATGANCLIVRMFGKEFRIDKADRQRYDVGFAPEYVFSGIGSGARLLREGVDYRVTGAAIVLASPGGELIDCYADAAWPERFTAAEMQERRLETKTINEWDSQYQLHSKPVTQLRLDPARMTAYGVLPEIRRANYSKSMWLGGVQIVGASCRWDPSSGKLDSDGSSVAVVLQDEAGKRYVQEIAELSGDIAEFGRDGKTITGGQVWQMADIVERYSLPRVSVETNGIGGFAPTVLRACLKQRKIYRCGVVEVNNTVNKNKRILESIEPLLLSRGMLWAHADVLSGPLAKQMRDWNPATQRQPDDLLDALAGAISETPERFKGVGEIGGAPAHVGMDDWRPGSGSFVASFQR